MKVRILRGATQIGGSCVEITHQGNRIVLDFGLPLEGNPDDLALVPEILGDDLKAVVISHPHLDHYGLLHHLPETIPVAIGDAARRLIRAAAPFTGHPISNLEGFTLAHERPLQIGSFKITPFLVDHSAFDAYALLIEAGGKRLFYSGDFRAHGRKAKLFERMVANPLKDIDVLLMEGSSLSRLEENDSFPKESELESELVEIMKSTTGLVMVHASAQNIDRIVTLYRACKRTGRTLIIDLYAASILEATGNCHIPQSDWPGLALYVPQSQRRLIKRYGMFGLLARHSSQRVFPDKLKALGPSSAILFRPLLMSDLEIADALAGSTFVYSQWLGYLEGDSYAEMQRWLQRHSLSLKYVHTSGHASPGDLQRFSAALAPKAIVPIHSFAPESYDKLFSNVRYHSDGEWWDL